MRTKIIRDKETLTATQDRLIEDETRRMKGEFFTPTYFVNLAHEYISNIFGEDWKEKYVVWDCASGTGNLTRDYKFKELYCSTLNESDIETMNQSDYNPEATKFQYDFLNDNDSKLPKELKESIYNGKNILFLINPPYATSSNLKFGNTSKKDVEKTAYNKLMFNEGFGDSSKNLYSQFLYRILKIQQINKNITICLFSPLGFLTGDKFNIFRKKFFEEFSYKNGFLFESSNFSDVAKNWGIAFTIFNYVNTNNKNFFNIDVINFNNDLNLNIINSKILYNTDNIERLNDWCRKDTKGIKQFDAPQLSTGLNIKQDGYGKLCEKSLGYILSKQNNIEANGTLVSLFTSTCSSSNSNGWSIFDFNLNKVVILFTVRKSISPDWVNSKDEYLAPTEEIQQTDQYKQFESDSIVYSLFNTSSNQSSMRQVEYKDKLWNIKNEFFFMSKDEMKQLAEDYKFDELYKDARQSDERYVYNLLKTTNLSKDAKDILETARELIRKSFEWRKIMNDSNPEYHLQAWDAGWYQIKKVLSEHFSNELKDFNKKYKAFEDRLRPQVYELGFLKGGETEVVE